LTPPLLYPDKNPHASPAVSREISAETKAWWAHRRRLYNFGLAASVVLAFVLEGAVTSWGITRGSLKGHASPNYSVYETLLGVIPNLFIIGVANLCYFLGPWSETRFRPANVGRYRRICFAMGLSFAMLLPLKVPVELALFCLAHPSWRQMQG
jgi:hypothetical protein